MIGFTTSRLIEVAGFLSSRLGRAPYALSVASADASFRRYLRVSQGDQATQILMDAPPELERVDAWLRIASQLRAAGVPVPQVHASNLQSGLVLMEDLGGTTMLAALDEQSAQQLYPAAIETLCRIQAVDAGALPVYGANLLRAEIGLYFDWLLDRHLGLRLAATESAALQPSIEALVDSALASAQAYVHRDYHSRNLMALADGSLGVLDFQDAVRGPWCYDLVSLLRDCYIAWPEAQQQQWLAHYAAVSGRDFDGDREREFDWMGVQRHLKAAGIFARLWHRDGKAGYLAELPRTVGYIHRYAGRYAELGPIADLAERVLKRLDAIR